MEGIRTHESGRQVKPARHGFGRGGLCTVLIGDYGDRGLDSYFGL